MHKVLSVWRGRTAPAEAPELRPKLCGSCTRPSIPVCPRLRRTNQVFRRDPWFHMDRGRVHVCSKDVLGESPYFFTPMNSGGTSSPSIKFYPCGVGAPRQRKPPSCGRYFVDHVRVFVPSQGNRIRSPAINRVLGNFRRGQELIWQSVEFAAAIAARPFFFSFGNNAPFSLWPEF